MLVAPVVFLVVGDRGDGHVGGEVVGLDGGGEEEGEEGKEGEKGGGEHGCYLG